MEKVLKCILYILLILLVVFAGYLGFRALKIFSPAKPGLALVPGTLEWSGLPPIILPPHLATNAVASNAAFEATQFLTNEPYIVSSNGKIYAGLYKRNWSMEYSVDQTKHEAGIIIGSDYYAGYYHFNPIGKLVVGGQIIWTGEEVKVAGSLGYRW